MSKQKRDMMTELKAYIIETGAGEAVSRLRIMNYMEAKGYDLLKVETVLEAGYNNGAFTCPRRDYYKVM